MSRKGSRKGVSNIVPKVKESCIGCFAVKDNRCMVLKAIIDDCPFKKEAERSEYGGNV